MRVATDNGLKAATLLLHIHFLQIVQHEDPDFIELDDFGFMDRVSPRATIVISADCNDRSEGPQSVEHVRRSDVTAVKNKINAGECCPDFRAHQTMRVRYDSNQHSSEILL